LSSEVNHDLKHNVLELPSSYSWHRRQPLHAFATFTCYCKGCNKEAITEQCHNSA